MHGGKPVNFAHGAPPRHSIRKRRDFYGRFPVVCPCAGAAGRGVGSAGACAVLRREEAHGGRETRTEYLQPNYGQTGGFRVSSAPSNETIIPYRYWLIEGQVSEIDYDIVPGRRMSLRTARIGQMLYPAGFFDLAFEDVQQYDIDGVTVTQRQNAGRITGISWTREGYEYLLYSLQPEMNMIAGLAVEFVTNTRAEAVV